LSSNLRAAPIEGFICDSAGNIIRNATITIRDNAPGGSNVIDTIFSDDNGYFISNPLKNGIYDIYESGVKTSRTIHIPSMNNFQCWAATPDNIPDNLPSYIQMDASSENDINKYRYYIQIENDDVDIQHFGHIFPIYDVNINSLSNTNWSKFYFFHGMTSDSRITTTRFDVEFFNPLTIYSNSYKRTRWVGVPAIRFSATSKLVIPLDFYSIHLNRLNSHTIFGLNINYSVNVDLETVTIIDTNNNDDGFIALANALVIGDIVKLKFTTNQVFYGIFTSGTVNTLIFKKIRNSNYISIDMQTLQNSQNTAHVATVDKYDGFFNGITNIGVSINEKFTIVENIYAQDIDDELYNYDDIPWLPT
jgi:hypothetical protein